ncbi:hypothetical protein ACP0HM_34780 [Escherichia coli]
MPTKPPYPREAYIVTIEKGKTGTDGNPGTNSEPIILNQTR